MKVADLSFTNGINNLYDRSNVFHVQATLLTRTHNFTEMKDTSPVFTLLQSTNMECPMGNRSIALVFYFKMVELRIQM